MLSRLCIVISLAMGLAAAALVFSPTVRSSEPAGLSPAASNGLRLLEEMQTVITELAEAAIGR